MNYVQRIRARLAKEIDVEDDLLDLYTLLAVVRGVGVTLEDVHDAWAVWRTKTKPEHKSIVPFDELSSEVQELDREYAEAISRSTHP